MMVLGLAACAVTGCEDSQREQGREELIQEVNEQIATAKKSAAGFDFDTADESTRQLLATVDESPYADVTTYNRLTADIEDARRELARLKADHREKLRAGWKVIDGRLVSPEEQRARAEKEREAQRRRAEEARIIEAQRKAEEKAREEAALAKELAERRAKQQALKAQRDKEQRATKARRDKERAARERLRRAAAAQDTPLNLHQLSLGDMGIIELQTTSKGGKNPFGQMIRYETLRVDEVVGGGILATLETYSRRTRYQGERSAPPPRTTYGPTLILKGVPTAGVVTGAQLSPKQVFEVVGTENLAIGGTVFVLEAVEVNQTRDPDPAWPAQP